ncbi:MAG: Undecaprenyl-phosphate N-acetylglucosaminyl 1-phosphate transferase, partial [uncultured Solirubrobacteraceae bacterium]
RPAPEPQARRRRAARAHPGRGLRRHPRERHAARRRGPRPGLARVSPRGPVDRRGGEPREPHRRDGLPRGRHRGDRRRVVRDPRRLVPALGRRRAGGDRVRGHARIPAPQLPPGEDLHGRHRGPRARVPARDPRARRPLQDGRGDHARGADARARRADPRHVVRGPQAAQVPSPAVRRGPQPLLPPLPAHRVLPAAHGGLPPRLGGAPGRLRHLRPVLPAAPARRLGPRALARPRRDRPARRRRVRVDGVLAGDPQAPPPRAPAPAPPARARGRARARRRAGPQRRPRL